MTLQTFFPSLLDLLGPWEWLESEWMRTCERCEYTLPIMEFDRHIYCRSCLRSTP